MVVVYYTTPYFLDAALETIQSIKFQVILHVVIEVAPESKQSNIINIPSLDTFNQLEDADKILEESEWKKLKPYFEGVCSVSFLIHKNKRGFSLASIKTAMVLGQYCKKIKANIIHFDSISARSIGLYPFIRFKKIFITIHDPIPHTGEKNWKLNIPRKIYFSWAKGFFFYSNYSLQLFQKNYPKIKAPLIQLQLQPYTIAAQVNLKIKERKGILFFGRLSAYKGLDLFIEAAKKIIKQHPKEQFIIAGSPSFNFSINHDQIKGYEQNFIIKEKYFTIEELSVEIAQSKLVVCPYRDATQSGVLMTAFANKRMVIATKVGAFPEYIEENKNGLLCLPEVDDLANKMNIAIANNYYEVIEQNIHSTYSEVVGNNNQQTILYAYDKVVKLKHKRSSSLKLFLTRKNKYKHYLKAKS